MLDFGKSAKMIEISGKVSVRLSTFPLIFIIYIYIYMKVNMDKIRQYEGSRKKYNPNR